MQTIFISEIWQNTEILLICMGYIVMLIIGAILLVQVRGKEKGKWYYYLPGVLFNMPFGVIGIYNWIILFYSVTWGSDRWVIVSICLGAYILLVLGSNIGAWLFFRRKQGFQTKLYAGCNLLSYTVAAIGYVMFMFPVGM